MITNARPTFDGPCHYYYPNGEAVWSVPNKSKPGETRKTTVRDARALKLVPSPTTVVRLLHRHVLVEWMIEQAVLAAMTTPRIEGEAIDAFIERVLHTDRVQDEEKNAAAERGKQIHRAIQDALSASREITGEMSAFVNPAVRELMKLGKVADTERTIIGNGYCGMTDCILENEHEVWDVDFKTCRTIPPKPYDEQLLQVAAYCGGLGNTGEKRIRGALVYISTTEPGKVEVKEVENWPHHYERFRLLLEFFRKTNDL